MQQKSLEKINFNIVVNRKNTNCLKYDFAVRRGRPENVLPLWVADMDFKVAPEITQAIEKRVAHGIFGYSEVKEEYFEAVSAWMEQKHGWHVKEDWQYRRSQSREMQLSSSSRFTIRSVK